MAEKKDLLVLDHVTHIYDTDEGNPVTAVNNVSFTVKKGETFGLVGESGCGKTTTGKMIVRLIGITKGKILYDGTDISSLKSRRQQLAYSSRVQMIFQDPYASLDPRMKVRDIIAEGLKIHNRKISSSEIDDKVGALLEEVGLNPDHATRYAHEFSGGQRQRIGIARALAPGPEFIVCDEPISALDVSIQAQVVNLLKNLQRKHDLTYIFIAHDLSMVKYMSDRIGVMCNGRLVELGSTDAVYNHPLHDYTRSLISAVPLPDPEEEKNRKRIIYHPQNPDHELTWQEPEPQHFVLA